MNDQLLDRIDDGAVQRLGAESFEKSCLAIAIGDVTTQTIRAVNHAFAAQRGYDPAELAGQPITTLFAADRLAEAQRQIAIADAEGHVSFESEHRARDGRRLPVLLDITVIRSADGRSGTRWVYAIDIAAMKQVEHELRDERMLLSEMSALAHVAGWSLDVATGHIRWTTELARIFDLPDDYAFTTSLGTKYFVAEYREQIERAMHDARERGEPFDLEFEIVSATGRRKWVHALTNPKWRAGRVATIRGTLQDITERRTIEAQLSLAERRYRVLTEEATPDAMYVHDDQGRFVEVNRKACESTGYTRDELLRMWIGDIERPFDLQAAQEAWRHIELGDTVTHDGIHRRKDGTSYPAETHVGVIEIDGTRRFIAFVRDVSERRRSDAALAESERRLRLAQSAARVGTWEWDVATNDNFWSDETYRLYELVPGECLPSYESWLACVQPEDRARLADTVARAVSQGTEIALEWRVNAAGPERWLYSRGQPQYDDAGRIARYLGIVLDITERKRAESTLRANESRYRDMFEANPNPMWVFDAETLTYLDVNDSAIRVYGYSRNEFLQMHIRDIRPPADVPLIDNAVHRAISGQSNLGVWRHWRKDGSELMVEVTARPLVRNGRPAVVVLAHDVTARIRAEQEIRALNARLEQRVAERTAQLEQANRAKTDFLANMSHELRTPLNAIIGFSQVLRDGVAGSLEVKQQDYVNDIFDAGQHLLALINDVLDLSKVEAGMQKLELSAQDVGTVLRSTMTVIKEKAHAHRIRLELDVDAALGTMWVDSRKAKQIVFNLLSNAVKFTPDGGTVTLSAHRCRREAVVADPYLSSRVLPLPPGEVEEFLEISVRDTGPGISTEKLGLLFEPFVQLDSTITRQHAGTGLGLSLTRRLAELHGGTVGIESYPGQGSRFIAWLPFRRQ